MAWTAAPAVAAYPLDSTSRSVPTKGKVRCPDVPIVRSQGTLLRYHRPIRVHPAFLERLARFEAIARDTAIEVYGRAPRRVRHLGTFNCRHIRGWPGLISEHGLGNGIDVAGFDFGRAKTDDPLPEGVPARLRRAFKVRVEDHWEDRRGAANAVHQRFLHTLAERLLARDDVFRVLLGPDYPGHRNHFHFDCSPWRLQDGFDDLYEAAGEDGP